jgi:hypothetical protein
MGIYLSFSTQWKSAIIVVAEAVAPLLRAKVTLRFARV